MCEPVLGEGASDISMVEIMEVYEDASSQSPIRKLMAAVLERGLLDIKENFATFHYEIFKDACVWFEDLESTGPFAYGTILHTLTFTQRQINMIERYVKEALELRDRIVENRREVVNRVPKSDKYLQKIIRNAENDMDRGRSGSNGSVCDH